MNTVLTLSVWVARFSKTVKAWGQQQTHDMARPVAPIVRRPAPAQAVNRPLRVVRVLEANQARTQTGRMVISGRMADVCAELDRLAACEAH